MSLSIEFVTMLIERLSNVEQQQQNIMQSIEKIVSTTSLIEPFCVCKISSIKFYENGNIEQLVTSVNPTCRCGFDLRKQGNRKVM